MIEAEHSLSIAVPISAVWTYVERIENWATLFPGCQDCAVANERDSTWTIKVGAGGLVKTVKVLVHVDDWSGPERVHFTYKLASEPVEGQGRYTARAVSPRETELALQLVVVGGGPMAPMWEAVSRPLLPQIAKLFASRLKEEIERRAGIDVAPTPGGLARLWQRVLALLLRFRSARG
jgi:carbon monoxide dehydrogenase subunit G